MDISELSDADLRNQLLSYGVNVGPIGATTRSFYEKKLGKLIDSGGAPPPKEESEEEEDDDEEVEDEEVTINYRTAPRTYAAPPRVVQNTTPVVQRKKETIPENYTPVTKARKATVNSPQVNKQDSRPMSRLGGRPASKPVAEKSGGGIAMWIKLLFIVIVAFLVYLVVINMNESAQPKIPVSHEEV